MSNIKEKSFTYHWLLYYIPQSIKDNYTICFDPYTHGYTLSRCYRSYLVDVFLIRRTSKKVYRVMHSNGVEVVYRSCHSVQEVADFVQFFYVYGQKSKKHLKKPPKNPLKPP